MYVSESPDLHGPLEAFTASVGSERLQVASIAEVYGASGFVDADKQRATFAGALRDALADGYSGIRVAADNTSLVVDSPRRAAWVQWELIADHFMSKNPVTGLCAFDRERVDVDVLRHLSTLHPLSNADSPTPQFRIFVDDGALWIEGDVNAIAIDEALNALEHMPWMTDLVVDLSTTSFVTKKLRSSFDGLSRAGLNVAVVERESDLEDLHFAADEAS